MPNKYPAIANSGKEDEWGMENVEFCIERLSCRAISAFSKFSCLSVQTSTCLAMAVKRRFFADAINDVNI